ncbi:MAG TPA: phosphoribosyltransferase family protein [Bacteroidia bacterium]|nr:phosphoribosyltransferase family protein [Bacteroidia bacterium]HRH07465.1 phosphoribosyltransferase family protein [Bacteroidia bacterium]HRH62138.1 phosphoribosyltransferase family protein [Bacteroidia bacterium]
MKTLILDHQQIAQKIQRIAHEIYEYNFEEKELIIAGIADRGYTLAERINKELLKISPIKTQLLSLKVDKEKQIISTVKLDLNPDLLKNKVVLLVDDVLNTGRTLSYAVYPFLEHEIKKLATVVLIDRNHNLIPIRADYVGLQLATTLKEHVSVEFAEGKDAAYLS